MEDLMEYAMYDKLLDKAYERLTTGYGDLEKNRQNLDLARAYIELARELRLGKAPPAPKATTKRKASNKPAARKDFDP
jgi:hypothetical protein